MRTMHHQGFIRWEKHYHEPLSKNCDEVSFPLSFFHCLLQSSVFSFMLLFCNHFIYSHALFSLSYIIRKLITHCSILHPCHCFMVLAFSYTCACRDTCIVCAYCALIHFSPTYTSLTHRHAHPPGSLLHSTRLRFVPLPYCVPECKYGNVINLPDFYRNTLLWQLKS